MHANPGTSLFNAVRAGFIARGYSLNRWCTEQGLTAAWVYQALQGKRRGPTAVAVARRAAEAAGVEYADA